MPPRSRMYFLTFDTTISTSSCSYRLESAGPPACAVTEPAAERGGDGAGGVGGRAAGAGAVNADGRGAGAGGRGAGAGRRGAGPSRSCAVSSRVGARASTAHASRWRSVATWESQQETEQNTSRVRSRLQVDTLHTQWVAPNGMGFRHALHRYQTSSSRSTMSRILVQVRLRDGRAMMAS